MNGSPRITRRAVPEGGVWPASMPPLLQRVYAARGALDDLQARPRLAQLHPPQLLSGMDAAVALLAERSPTTAISWWSAISTAMAPLPVRSRCAGW